MAIRYEHMVHGAAFAQIVEHDQFAAINVRKHDGVKSRSAHTVNDSIGIFVKYCKKPRGPFTEFGFTEYTFNFTTDQLAELDDLRKSTDDCFAVLICLNDGEICALPYSDLMDLVGRRIEEMNGESQYSIVVGVRKHSKLRVWTNSPGKKGELLGGPIIIPRGAFPGCLFRA